MRTPFRSRTSSLLTQRPKTWLCTTWDTEDRTHHPSHHTWVQDRTRPLPHITTTILPLSTTPPLFKTWPNNRLLLLIEEPDHESALTRALRVLAWIWTLARDALSTRRRIMRLFLPCVLYGISIISFCLSCPHYYYIFYHKSCLLPDDKTYPPIHPSDLCPGDWPPV